MKSHQKGIPILNNGTRHILIVDIIKEDRYGIKGNGNIRAVVAKIRLRLHPVRKAGNMEIQDI